jgi:L-threonate 2-dehydrogenase
LTRMRPILDRITGKLFTVGDRVGHASTFKIVNNLLAGANLAAAAEAVAIASRAGLDLRQVSDVINASSGGSWMFADRMPRVMNDDYTPHAAAKILTKDVAIAVALAQRLGVDPIFGRAALAAFNDVLEAGYAEDDDAVIVKRALEKAGGRNS